jgi:RNA polymerase sigma-70 factor (ECF subfamily)
VSADFDLVSYLPALRNYAAFLTRDRDAAQDLVQDVCVQALSKRHLYQPDTNLRAWLFTIMHNRFISLGRRSGRSVAVDPATLEAIVCERGDPFDHVASVQLVEAIERAQLPRGGDWLIRKRAQGYDHEALARATGEPIGTVKSRLSRSRQRIREAM